MSEYRKDQEAPHLDLRPECAAAHGLIVRVLRLCRNAQAHLARYTPERGDPVLG